MTRLLPESGFLRYHIDAKAAAGAGYLAIRAENPQTKGLGGGAEWIRTPGSARFVAKANRHYDPVVYQVLIGHRLRRQE